MRTILLLFLMSFSVVTAQNSEVLVFHKTEGWHHESIPTGIATMHELGQENSFAVTDTDDAALFTEENLKKYDLVVFLNTTEDVLNRDQEKAFEGYINNGGSFFGIHSAADTEYDWEWYGDLVGAYFLNHPEVQEAEVLVQKPDHPTVAHLPETWRHTDEWYNYKDINPNIEVLLTLNEDSYQGGENGDFHPIAWFRELETGGRSVYTGGGHTDEAYHEPAFREHLLQCVLFALRR